MKSALQPVRCILDTDHTSRHQLSSFLSIHWSLFALFFHTPPFVFNSLQPLFRKHPGWGYLYKSPLWNQQLPASFFRPCLQDSYPQPSVLPSLRVSAPAPAPTWSGRQSIYCPFVFILLRIPFPTNPFFSHPYKTPGGVGGHLCHPSMEIVRMSPVASLERVYGTGSAGEDLLFFGGFYEQHDDHAASGRDDQDAEQLGEVLAQLREFHPVQHVHAQQQRAQNDRDHADEDQECPQHGCNRLCRKVAPKLRRTPTEHKQKSASRHSERIGASELSTNNCGLSM